MTGGYDAVMPPSYTGTVTWVLSADTMHIAMLTGPLAGRTVNFRLAKWDAWEDAGPMRLAGSLARASVLEWLPPDRAVTGLYLGTDAFGRPAGTISRASDGADLGSYLAAQGAAVAYPQPWERRAESGGNIPMLPLPVDLQPCPGDFTHSPRVIVATFGGITGVDVAINGDYTLTRLTAPGWYFYHQLYGRFHLACAGALRPGYWEIDIDGLVTWTMPIFFGRWCQGAYGLFDDGDMVDFDQSWVVVTSSPAEGVVYR